MPTKEEIREGIMNMVYPDKETIEREWGVGNIEESAIQNSYAFTDEILAYLHSQGVVIKVDRELPEPTWGCRMIDGAILADRINSKRAGYVAVVPLIDKE